MAAVVMVLLTLAGLVILATGLKLAWRLFSWTWKGRE